MVNWFRKDPTNGRFMWPGFGENIRVLDWILRRCDGEDSGEKSIVGMVPKNDALNLEGLDDPVDMKGLMSTPKEFWLKEVEELEQYFAIQVGECVPKEILDELEALKQRALKQDEE